MAYRKDLQILLEPAARAAGYELLGCEFISQGKHSVLRVYIDQAAGITIDDCEIASRQISAVLDVEDPIKSEYCLEVSSPGLERPLFTIAHYQRAQGQQAMVNLHTPLAGRRKLRGVIEKISNQQVVLNDAGETFTVSLDNIIKAHLVNAPGIDK